MPSSSDGSPIVRLQALTFGLAIVVNQAGGFVELIELDVNGF